MQYVRAITLHKHKQAKNYSLIKNNVHLFIKEMLVGSIYRRNLLNQTMKKIIFALFTDIEVADRVINHIHNELDVANDEISYVYKNRKGDEISGDGEDVTSPSPTAGAVSGATTGGLIGAAVGLVGIAGLLGPLGPIVVAGPLATFLGITGGAGAIVGTGVAGAAIGGIVGALISMGVSEPEARNYEERVDAGDVLVSIHTEKADAVSEVLREFGAKKITVVEEQI